MLAETMAGIALVKSAVDGIKSAIGTANDIGDIASHIDKLFEGEKQVQQKRANKSGVGNVGDQLGIKSVAKEMIDAKIAQEQMREVATMVDMRFGSGTWKSIVEERAKRIQEAKEAVAEEKRIARKKHNEMVDTIKLILGIVAVSLFGAAAIALAIMYASK